MDRETLERDARRALEMGKIELALELYQHLELHQYQEPVWSKQVANLHRTMGNEEECVAALSRAAERCAAKKEPLKAIAACKMALAIRPEHEPAVEVLRKLIGTRRARVASDVIRPPPEALAPTKDKAPLAVLPLVRMATPIQPIDDVDEPGVHRLPIEFEEILPTLAEVDEPGVLPPIPLFSALGTQSFQSLIERSRLFSITKGETLFRQGDPGDALYIVIEGCVTVFLEEQPRVKVADLKEGEFFGEIALFTDNPRGATIEASTDSELLEINRAVINELIVFEPEVLSIMLSFLRERLVKNLFQSSPLFRQFVRRDRDELGRHFHLVDVDASTTLIREGSQAKGLYVLVDGTLEVNRQAGSGPIATLLPGHICGEISSMTQLPAVASVVAKDKCLLLMLPEKDIRELVVTYPQLLTYATKLAQERMEEIAKIAKQEKSIQLV